MNKKKSQYNAGISLIEVLIATAIFSVVMVVSVGALISMNNSNKKAQTTRIVMDNLNFAMENMSRNLRIGTTYHCAIGTGIVTSPRDCSIGSDASDSSISFFGHKGNQIIYRLNSSNHQIESSIDAGLTYLPITSPELSVDNLIFYVVGAPAGDGKQPRVTIVISGTAVFSNGTQSKFQVETSASQRQLDS